ncbi:MAG TPA: hypothetical protein VHQ46_02925, partial [Desulfobacteria bacterium]|nr:hypothetical protein [Desulfobacteria bacterium]
MGFVNWLKRLKSPLIKVAVNPTTQRYVAGAVFFLLITALLSGSLFVNRLDVTPGEPSTVLVQAPWPKVIQDRAQWESNKADAASKVPDFVIANDDVIKGLADDLATAFSVLKTTQADTTLDDKGKVAKLKGTIPFTSLPDNVLASLLKDPLNSVTAAELDGSRVIVDTAKDTKTGALNNDDIPALKDRIKKNLDQLKLTPELGTMLDTFVDAKVSSPTLEVDRETTETQRKKAEQQVPIPEHAFSTNEKIVGVGEVITPWIYTVLQEYGLIQTLSPWKSAAGIGLVVLASMAAVLVYIYTFKREVFKKNAYLILLGLVITLVLGLGRGIISLNLGPNYNSLLGFLVPVAWGSMLIAILVDSQLAIMVTATIANSGCAFPRRKGLNQAVLLQHRINPGR